MATLNFPINPYEWSESSADFWTRTCLGHEASASFNENIANGHTELSIVVSFRVHHPASNRNKGTELELDELVARARQAWIQVRYLRPECAVEMDTHTDPSIPQNMTYRVLRDQDSLRSWVSETFVVTRLGEPGARTLDEITSYTYNRPLPTKGKQSMLYLVLPRLGDDGDRSAHLIWNVAHAVTDGGSIADFYNVLLQCLIDATPSAPYCSIYTPSAFELNVLPRLPRSVVCAYQQQYKPSSQQIESAKREARLNMRLVSERMSQSLALIPAPSFPNRTHSTICLIKAFSETESRALLDFAKTVKSGVTYLASAATIMATAETFPERKATSTGALMGMVRNARRWLSTTPVDGVSSTSTPLGSDAVFLWIPVDTQACSFEPHFSLLPTLINIAHRIRIELDTHLTTPHSIASYPLVADAAVSGLAQQWSSITSTDSVTPQSELDNIIGPQAPGFSSVGIFKVHPRFAPISASINESGLWLERWDLTHLGRQVNASPWMSMLTIDGRIKFQLGFDTKFHDLKKMEQFMERTYDWMKICAASAGTLTSTERIDALRVTARL
ncbi:probable Acyltransferase invovled in MEL production [Melanopsichium pennsylvanicum]|uniref:Acyltransferase invovled in MEL production n=2 Tax=Melanopsichium pennsylvanicum TaxID=63383 RepID=A0A077R4Z5_9BASI|nr:conserved hypothetical protein [Melanopsichium pennsylvanicum 4]SNX87153.1 probable Acyltransferase invovled in MEL production [Melanopsichium pennsylvanicum]